jgi:hypothetical protein
MKKIVLFSAMFILATVVQARGSITLLSNDQVKYLGQISGQSAGNGGAFDWKVTALGHPIADYGADPPTIGEHFSTFCTELTQTISAGTTYKVKTNPYTPVVGGSSNTSGKTWLDLSGVFLFERWSDGALAWAGHTSSDIAAAVQVALWKSENYSNSSISSNGGLTASAYTTQISTWLTAFGYTGTWTSDNTKVVELTTLANGYAQDQIVLVSVPEEHEAVPEPISVLVWTLLGLCAFGGYFARRRIGRYSASR